MDFLGQIVALLGQFVAILEGFNILIYVGIYASVYKGFNDFVIQASMLSYIQASMTLLYTGRNAFDLYRLE